VLADVSHRSVEALRDGLRQQSWPTLRVLCGICAMRAALEPAFERFHAESKVRVFQTRVSNCPVLEMA